MYGRRFALRSLIWAWVLLLVACSGMPNPVKFLPTTPTPADPSAGRVAIRWFVGLGAGETAAYVAALEQVTDDFNASQERILLTTETVPYGLVRDILSTQIASGDGPDVVGMVGWNGTSGFEDQWLDLTPYLPGIDTGMFDPALLRRFATESGQTGLPFGVFPTALFFVPEMFAEAGLAYPPQTYGERYTLDGRAVPWNWETVTEVARRLTLDAANRRAVDPGFDRARIIQVGFSAPWQPLLSLAAFAAGPGPTWQGDPVTGYQAYLPDRWKAALAWYYDGMWGEQPFIASGPLASSLEFGSGDVFSAGKAAMGLTQSWYIRGLGGFRDAGLTFQLGILPVDDESKVNSILEVEALRIWKGTRHPQSAFEFLSYLVTQGGDSLLPVYGALPAVTGKRAAFIGAVGTEYPFVSQASWHVFIQGIQQGEVAAAALDQPNPIKAAERFLLFGDVLVFSPDLDLNGEMNRLVEDLTRIYNEK